MGAHFSIGAFWMSDNKDGVIGQQIAHEKVVTPTAKKGAELSPTPSLV